MDSYAGALVESGDIVKSKCDIKAELGEVIAGIKGGRKSLKTRTIYKSLGLAVQDLTAAKLITDISQSIDNPFPIKRVKMSDVEIKSFSNVVPKTNISCTETICKAESTTFVSKVTFYLHLTYITCELAITRKDGGAVCTALCFIYDAKNGQLITIIEDWNPNADEQDKIRIVSHLSGTNK